MQDESPSAALESAPMHFDRDRVRAGVREAPTEDLLDRATLYRDGMEPEALDLIEQELWRRGLKASDLECHAQARSGALRDAAGLPYRCARCDRPAEWAGWRWHRLWGVLPVFPHWTQLCREHAGGV